MDYFKIIELNGKRLAVYKTGEIVFWDTIKNRQYKNGWNIHNGGIKNNYKNFMINGKNYYHHRILAFCFLGLDIENTKIFIDHINRNTLDNNLENLRLTTNSQNQFNRIAKGYSFIKNRNKFHSSIVINGKTIFLGEFDIEEEARQAYLQAKEIYHKI